MVLRHEIQLLKQKVESQKAQTDKETTLLYVELGKKNKLHADGTTKAHQLEVARGS